MASGDTFHHIRDSVVFELPSGSAHPIEVPLPEVFGLQITKFMVLQLVAFALTFLIFRGLARRVQQGGAPARKSAGATSPEGAGVVGLPPGERWWMRRRCCRG